MSLEQLESAYWNGGSREAVLEAVSSSDPSEVGPHGTTAVHIVAKNVDPESLETLLSRGFRAGAADEYGRTPLHILATQRWDGRVSKMAECTDLLLSHRCPPSRRDDSGNCFYHIAAKMHNFPMIEVMGQRKVRCDSLIESSGMNALHLMCEAASMYDFIRERSPDEFAEKDRMCRRMAERLVECGIDPDAETRIGKKALDFAVENGIKSTSAFLAGDESEVSGGMDLVQAVIVNDPDAIDAIISSGADPDGLCDRGGEYAGMTPLMVACRRMARESALALLRGGATASRSSGTDDRTALYHLLVSLSSQVGTGVNDRGSKPFAELLKAVIEKHGVDHPIGTEEGPALCFVAGKDHLGWTSDGKSARMIAFDALMASSADHRSRDAAGRTPLMLACDVPGPDSENIVSTLMEVGADLDARDAHGMSALMHAASVPRDGGLDLVKIIYDFGEPDLSFRDDSGRDALELAAGSDSRSVLEYLMGR